MSGKKRPERTERRERERAAKKNIALRQRLAQIERGGAPDRPIVVPSSSVVELRARSLRCPLCEGEYLVDEQTASSHHGKSLRVTHLTCRLCGVSRPIYFAIASPLAN